MTPVFAKGLMEEAGGIDFFAFHIKLFDIFAVKEPEAQLQGYAPGSRGSPR